jgi:hypothetical protein
MSPVTDRLSHLRFRWRDPQAHWLNPDEGQWELYSCTPKGMVTPDRATQFAVHWADLPKAEQAGRKAFVTTYQFHMWHTHGVEVRRHWVLQGPWGGTAAEYTARERRYLDAAGAVSDALPLGFFAACPFDERSVQAILRRDRLLALGNDVDALARQNKPEAQQVEDAFAERIFRDRWLDWWYETIQPQAEFMKHYLKKSEADTTFRRATREEASAVTQWKDHYRETGEVIGAGLPGTRKANVAVR